MIIAFTGLHGSGKTRFAKFTENFLENKYKTHTINIVKLSFLRKISQSNKTKEYSSFIHLFIRIFSFIIDLIIFKIFILKFKSNDILIFDRYFHDKFANFNMNNPFFYFLVEKLMINDFFQNFLVFIGVFRHVIFNV